ncbi:MAG: AAA family ATPase [Nitrospirae bacterium]|nr:AAA family ATPase [Nitrospirota bacterium]
MTRLFHKKLVIVTGKGGVGKSTTSAALAVLARRKKKRPLVLELTEFEAMPTLFGSKRGRANGDLVADGIRSMRIILEEAIPEYLTLKLKIRAVSDMLYKNPVVKYFTKTAPGFQELVVTGKIWYMAQEMAKNGKRHPYDFIIFDAPSTGHCLQMLKVPRVVSQMVRVGPIVEETEAMHDFYHDPDRSGILLVTLLQEMPINEATQMAASLRDDQDLGIESLVINEVFQVDKDVLDEKARAACPEGASEEAWAALEKARQDLEMLHDAQEIYRERLKEEVKAPQVELPLLLKSPLATEDIEIMADALEEKFE